MKVQEEVAIRPLYRIHSYKSKRMLKHIYDNRIRRKAIEYKLMQLNLFWMKIENNYDHKE